MEREGLVLNFNYTTFILTYLFLKEPLSFLQFFDHPIVIDLMFERWYRDFRGCKRGCWLYLNLWCILDIVFFPLMFGLARVLGNVKLL